MKAYKQPPGVIREAAVLIGNSRYLTAFTGAGISTESGIPPFRGPGGLWSKYPPNLLALETFNNHPEKVWPVLKELFYQYFAQAEANEAHHVLARLERAGYLKTIITQNIDSLHYLAGSRRVIEFHGNSRTLRCIRCNRSTRARPELLDRLPPLCPCGGLLKPAVVFFGENIPQEAFENSQEAVARTDVMLVVGSTGEVYPAASIPQEAAAQGAKIIEINPQPSHFTAAITDLFIPLKAARALSLVEAELRRFSDQPAPG